MNSHSASETSLAINSCVINLMCKFLHITPQTFKQDFCVCIKLGVALTQQNMKHCLKSGKNASFNTLPFRVSIFLQ